MRRKKIQVKIMLTADTVTNINEIAPDSPCATTAALILESTKSWKGDLIELMYHIKHPKKGEHS